MDHSGDSGGDTPQTPPVSDDTREAFGRLADATRIEILRLLADAQTPIEYATLLDGVSVTDSGQLNYHLRQLRGEYVRQTDEGYELRQRGLRAANFLASRSLQNGVEREFRQIDSRCGHCDSSSVEIGYQQGEGIVRCRSCDQQLTRFDFPPDAARVRSLDAFVDAYARRTRAYVALADDGVCPFCSHPMETTVCPSAGTDADGVPVVGNCSRCPAGIRAPIGLVLLNRPRVLTAFHAAGVELGENPFWEHRWCTYREPVVQGTEPLEVALETTGTDENLRVIVDADVQIQGFTHRLDG